MIEKILSLKLVGQNDVKEGFRDILFVSRRKHETRCFGLSDPI